MMVSGRSVVVCAASISARRGPISEAAIAGVDKSDAPASPPAAMAPPAFKISRLLGTCRSLGRNVCRERCAGPAQVAERTNPPSSGSEYGLPHLKVWAQPNMAESPSERAEGRRMVYDGFISYSHAADGRLAPALQRGLQRLAKSWNSRSALRIFRDETGLSTNPHLWSAIEKALDDRSSA